MPPPFVWLDGCTPLHIHTSVDKYNLAYFISNRRRDSGSCVTYLDIFPLTQFDWNEDASLLALAALLALGFVLMHTVAWSFLKEVCIFIFRRAGAAAALVFLVSKRRLKGGEKKNKNKNVGWTRGFLLSSRCLARCASARRDFFFLQRSSLLCSAQRSLGSLLCYSCGPAGTRVRSSAYSRTPTRSWSSSCEGTITACQHNTLWYRLNGVSKIQPPLFKCKAGVPPSG